MEMRRRKRRNFHRKIRLIFVQSFEKSLKLEACFMSEIEGFLDCKWGPGNFGFKMGVTVKSAQFPTTKTITIEK
jgi:hypothetical protein